MGMKVVAFQKKLADSSLEDLDQIGGALDLLCEKFPEQLIQELGLRTLSSLVKIAKTLKEGVLV